MSCNEFNQYYTDIVDASGNLVSTKCFNGGIYKGTKAFNVNSYKNYKSNDYYTWVNNNFKEYAFPDERYDSDIYDEEVSYRATCENKAYSLKHQQKFAGRIFNTNTKK